jgi:MFS family permease
MAFFGANCVAMIFLTWMPTFLKEKFHLNLAWAGFNASFFVQVASLVGATLGGVWADRWYLLHRGGRMFVQCVGALLGVPFLVLCGQTQDMRLLLVFLTCFGLSKGLYDANIWASLYEVVPPARRSTAVGVMNMIGWLGGGLGAWGIGRLASQGIQLSSAISGTAGIYLGVALLLCFAGILTARKERVAKV